MKRIGALLAALGLTAFWALAAALANKPFLPGPLTTISALFGLVKNGSLIPHLGASLGRVLLAMVCAFIPASALGLAAGRSKKLDAFVSPLAYLVHPLPKIAFLPVILVVMGLGEVSKVFLVAIIVFTQILVSARDAAARIHPLTVEAVRSLGAGRMAIARLVVLPAVLPDLFTALRVSMGTAIAVLFMAETFASESGLGWFIIDAWTRVAYPSMYAGILALGLCGLGLFALLDAAERIACPWRFV